MSDLPPPSFGPPPLPPTVGPAAPPPTGPFAPPSRVPPPPGGRSNARWWIVGGAASAVLIAVALIVMMGGDDESPSTAPSERTEATDAADETEPTDTTADTTADTVADTTADTSEPTSTTTGVPLTLPSTIVPTAPDVDLGNGVGFALPDGFIQDPVGRGIQITDGTVRLFALVDTRVPGDDPLLFAQEYIDNFESNFDSASFSQAIPAEVDTAGLAPSDGYFIYYRVMDVDGTGFRGVIDATRRADGLVYLTDTYRPIDDDSGNIVPNEVYDQFYSSYLDAPLLGETAVLTPLALTRTASIHPTFQLDGVVALSPPAGWTVDQPGPQRVAFAKPDGQRFAAVRLADTADALVAQDQAFAALQVALPGATIDGFEPSREGEAVISFDTAVDAVDAASGRAIEGVARVWIDAERSQVFAALSYNFVDSPPSIFEESFLIQSLDLSLIDDH